VDGGFILVDSLRRKSIIRKKFFFPFSFLGRIAAGRELMSSFSTMNSATFPWDMRPYPPPLPAARRQRRKAQRNFDVIFFLLCAG